MKKPRKASSKTPQKDLISNQEPSEPVPKESVNKTMWWVWGGVLLVISLVSAGWYLGHQETQEDPYTLLSGYKYSRHEFIVKSSEISIKLVKRAIQELRDRKIDDAINDCNTAIDIFPINTKPYNLLTKFYLMTGQEQKLYETLTLAGRSYPNFDTIVSVIDDADLDRIPLDEPQDNVFLANFPENKKMAISFMFDDGEADVYKALPTFEKYGYRATIPIIAGYVSDTSNDLFWGSWAEWRDAANRGFEIANHSMYHKDSKDMHGKDFDVSIDQAKEVIEKNIGHPVTAYVFPHDSYTDEAVSRALRLHKAVRTKEFLQSFYKKTVDIVYGGPHVSLETANRLIDIGIKRRLWIISKSHGVSEKRTMRSFKSFSPEFLDQHLAYIHSKAGDVWVDTFSNVFDYMFLRSQTTIETKAYTDQSADFILHNNDLKAKLVHPLTVEIRVPGGESVESATGGHALKVWDCDADKWCIDVDNYDENIHVKFNSKMMKAAQLKNQ